MPIIHALEAENNKDMHKLTYIKSWNSCNNQAGQCYIEVCMHRNDLYFQHSSTRPKPSLSINRTMTHKIKERKLLLPDVPIERIYSAT